MSMKNPFEFLHKEEQESLRICDRIVIFDSEKQTVEIAEVDSENEEIVRAGNKVFPKPDLSLSLSKQGRVFVFQAPTRIIEATEHLARVERNTIIRQIAQYQKPIEEHKPDLAKMGLFIALVLVSIIGIVT